MKGVCNRHGSLLVTFLCCDLKKKVKKNKNYGNSQKKGFMGIDSGRGSREGSMVASARCGSRTWKLRKLAFSNHTPSDILLPERPYHLNIKQCHQLGTTYSNARDYVGGAFLTQTTTCRLANLIYFTLYHPCTLSSILPWYAEQKTEDHNSQKPFHLKFSKSIVLAKELHVCDMYRVTCI